MDEATLEVTVNSHWVGSWLLLWAARPYVVLDGEEHLCRWSHPITLQTSAGTHHVVTCCRYKGISALLGKGEIKVTLEPGQTRNIVARNGTPFRPRIPIR